MYRIESFLSARMFLAPQLSGERLFFISNLSGHFSLYSMKYGGSVPQPLIPGDIALQNPHLMDETNSFAVFPKLGKVLVMIDKDGDERYQPMVIPMSGDFPRPAFGDTFKGCRVFLGDFDPDTNILYLAADRMTEPLIVTYRANLETGELTELARSMYGMFPVADTADHRRVILSEGYTVGDQIVIEWNETTGERKLLFGIPLEQREPGQEVLLAGFKAFYYTNHDQGLLVMSALTEDTYSLGYLDLANPGQVVPVKVEGQAHTGAGEMQAITRMDGDRYALEYNIDGVAWLYVGDFDPMQKVMRLKYVACGQGELSNGVQLGYRYDKDSRRFALAFSTATSPTQLYTVEGQRFDCVVRHTDERVFGIPQALLSPGEDVSYTSFDGLRISARLYRPAEALGFKGPRPVVFYVHGGPQGQERPDFSWFSMPLIQYLTLNGFAVYVPNARGSTGYGLSYTKRVDHDWGGLDRQDHIYAFDVLGKDPGVDASRAAVVGRSYGGYMTLTLAARHPEKWSAAVDMFGPYDLLTFMERIPETWKPYFKLAMADPDTQEGHAFLVERSPKTYVDQIQCPLLVIQGRNDPRVAEQESHDLVDHLREQGKPVEYIVFENEGHDVIKNENRVICYNAITEFFKQYLKP